MCWYLKMHPMKFLAKIKWYKCKDEKSWEFFLMYFIVCNKYHFSTANEECEAPKL